MHNNPIRLIDPDGIEAEDEWEVKKNEDGSTTTTKTGTEGGDKTDHITYKDAEGNVTGKETVDVQHTTVEGEIFSEDRGPGYDFKMIGTLSPAIEPTDDPLTSGDVLAIAGLRFLFKKGIKSLGKHVDDLFGTVPKGPGAKGYKRVKTKSIKKINQGRKASWVDKERKAREGLKGAKTKKEKAAFKRQIKHAINKQRKSETHWN